jgi:hypothetical protein
VAFPVAALMRETHAQPCDCVWCRFERDPAVVVTDAMVDAGMQAYTHDLGDRVRARAHVRAILEAVLAAARGGDAR